MNISIKYSPKYVSLTGNPVMFEVATGLTKGINSSLILALEAMNEGAVRADFSITINAFTFLFSNTIGSPNNYYATDADLLALFRTVLNQYVNVYYITSLYEESGVASKTAAYVFVKKPAYTSATIGASMGEVEHTVFDNKAVSDILKFYKIKAKIELRQNTNGEWITNGTDTADIDAEGVAKFNVSSFLNNGIENYLYDYNRDFGLKNSADSSYFFTDTGQVIQYKCTFNEEYIDYNFIPVTEISIESSVFIGLYGMLSDEKFDELSKQDSSFYQQLLTNKFFLSYQPNTKFITESCPESLFYFHTSYVESVTSNVLSVMTRIYYTDGSVSAVTKLYDVQPTRYKLYEIRADYQMLKSCTTVEKDVSHYLLWIENINQYFATQIRKYVIDRKYRYYERMIKYRNSFGVWDTLRCFGVAEKTGEYKFSEYISINQNRQGNVNVSKRNIAEETEKYKANIGYTEDEIYKESWRELLMSEDVYMMHTGDGLSYDSGVWHRIVITSQKLFIKQDRVAMYDMEFEYKKAYANKAPMLRFTDNLGNIDFATQNSTDTFSNENDTMDIVK